MIPAVEIGHRAANLLAENPSGIVMSAFRVAVHLLCDDERVLVVVLPTAGWGPLDVVVPGLAPTRVKRCDRFEARPGWLTVGELTIALGGAPVRVCRPDWHSLTMAARTVARDVWNEALRELRCAWLKTDQLGLEKALSARGAAVVQASAQESNSALEGAVRGICGFGPGLTPAGDDWLAGWLLGLRLLDVRHVERCAESVMSVAGVRTTRLSHAYLECAAAGEADSVWHSFLEAMTRTERDGSTSMAIRNTLARGASSGIAAVTGFFAALDSATAQEMMTCRP